MHQNCYLTRKGKFKLLKYSLLVVLIVYVSFVQSRILEHSPISKIIQAQGYMYVCTVDSLYLELARDQRTCSRQREFEIEREKQVTAYTKRPRLQFEIERSSRQRVFEIERVDCYLFSLLSSGNPYSGRLKQKQSLLPSSALPYQGRSNR